ncbi:winged helix-turn-helix transcriptional regulator [Williamsia sterculiae]|uniref:Transcriptional regulator, HxlR family n=1 Tax=Williamsia sterculiae TaxID=1344003 RepID=A0A1N7CK20_9NOCA|nr:helix-turn-helix domain-containing protein [Williamsia sterculiae]SIR63966.1 transcriptional regulator, HxlR family [Williamsia sterculiae]
MARQDSTSATPGHLEVTTDARGDLYDTRCPTRELLDRVGSKWTVMVVLRLAEVDTLRFAELRRSAPGVSQKMLTQTLRRLETDGLVARRVEPVSPPAVHYSLTDLGRTLVPALTALKEWAETHMRTVDQRPVR